MWVGLLDWLSVIHISNLEADIRRASAGTFANNLKSGKIESFDEGLWNDCLVWTAKRNKHAHSMANISDKSQTTWRLRLREAKVVSVEGFAIVIRVFVEPRKQKI